MVRGIVIWGLIAIVAAIAAAILAARKNRDASAWAAWGFLFPPAILLLLLPKLSMARRRRTLDEEDAAQARVDGY